MHLRVARPGQINISIGRGVVDFPAAIRALTAAGYTGYYSLELGDPRHRRRRSPEAGRAGRSITSLLPAA